MPTLDQLELSVVVPVFRDGKGIASVIVEWTEALDRLEISYELLVYDDGSGDGTLDVVSELASTRPRVRVRRHPNQGHGPTVRRGYREASGEWVFQLDSDHEIPVQYFEQLWDRREESDLLVARRDHAAQPYARRWLSRWSSLTVRALFGRGVDDVNAPYRLMRNARLQELLPFVPESAFAPNVILSGLFARRGLRLYELPVEVVARTDRKSSLIGTKLWRGVVRSFFETVRAALTTRPTS